MDSQQPELDVSTLSDSALQAYADGLKGRELGDDEISKLPDDALEAYSVGFKAAKAKPVEAPTEEQAAAPVPTAREAFLEAKRNLKPDNAESEAAFRKAHQAYYGSTSIGQRIIDDVKDYSIGKAAEGVKGLAKLAGSAVHTMAGLQSGGIIDTPATRERLIAARQAKQAQMDAANLEAFKAAVATGDQAAIQTAKHFAETAQAELTPEEETQIRNGQRIADARGLVTGTVKGAAETLALPAAVLGKAAEAGASAVGANKLASRLALTQQRLLRGGEEVAELAASPAGKQALAEGELIGSLAPLPAAPLAEVGKLATTGVKAAANRALQGAGKALSGTASALTDIGIGAPALALAKSGIGALAGGPAAVGVATSRKGLLGLGKRLRDTATNWTGAAGETVDAARAAGAPALAVRPLDRLARVGAAGDYVGEGIAKLKDKFGFIPATAEAIGQVSPQADNFLEGLAASASKRARGLETGLVDAEKLASAARPGSLAYSNLQNLRAEVKSAQQVERWIEATRALPVTERAAKLAGETGDALTHAMLGAGLGTTAVEALDTEGGNSLEGAVPGGALGLAVHILARAAKAKPDGTVEISPKETAARTKETLTELADAVEKRAAEPVEPVAEPALTPDELWIEEMARADAEAKTSAEASVKAELEKARIDAQLKAQEEALRKAVADMQAAIEDMEAPPMETPPAKLPTLPADMDLGPTGALAEPKRSTAGVRVKALKNVR